MDLHSEQLHTCTPDSYRLFLRRKRLVTLALLAVLAAILVGAGIIYGAEHWSKHAPENKEDKDDE